MTHLFILIILSTSAISIGHAQLAGIRAYAGLTTITNQDPDANSIG